MAKNNVDPEEKITAEEQPAEEEKVMEEQEDLEEELTEEGGGGREFAFPTAPIVRIMKEELDDYKMIRSRVKVEMNKWLEDLCRRVTRKMNHSDYTMVELSDFRTAIEPYERIGDIEVEKERIIVTMEKIKMDCDSLIRDVNRKFIAPDTKDGQIEEITEPQEPVE